MSRIKINDMPNDIKISREEMIKIIGGIHPDLAFLDVWQRQMTAVEDSDLFEVATGGPSTEPRHPYRLKFKKKSFF